MKKAVALTALLHLLPINHALASGHQALKSTYTTKIFLTDFSNSLGKSLLENQDIYLMDSCTEEECTTTPWKREDNYSFWHNGKKKENLHEYQKTQFRHEVIESAVDAIKETPLARDPIYWFDNNLKDWGRIELAGRGSSHIKLYAPGVKNQKPSKWNILLSPTLKRKEDSFGYTVGLNTTLKYGANTTGELIWQPQQKEIKLKANRTLTKEDDIKSTKISLEANVSYNQKTKDKQAYISLNWNF